MLFLKGRKGRTVQDQIISMLFSLANFFLQNEYALCQNQSVRITRIYKSRLKSKSSVAFRGLHLDFLKIFFGFFTDGDVLLFKF